MLSLVLVLSFAALLLPQSQGHMSLQEPPARNVLWRMGFSHLPPQPNDDYLICAQRPRAPCPPCGDSAEVPRPRPYEGGGKYATGTIGRKYTMGQKIKVQVNVTKNHGGTLEFKLCPHNNPNKPVDQRCLDQYPLEVVGTRSRSVPLSAPHNAPYYSQEMVNVELKLPTGISCDQCVLQMTNTAEEFKPKTVMFRNCADIAIEGNAKTSMAAGTPGAHPPLEIHTRGGFGAPLPEQKQHRFFD
ncbi:uncharacterized protein LOC127008281 [Eriocheir sinensis]|uniref:uncharacterized protein LOC127008281 n=1 Tax=Eriocheir sinensis TaxID=95602 RepID=UPI0021C81DE7|nr:uncharacterized protein LOC127008281 [Eriocheir sinensis]